MLYIARHEQTDPGTRESSSPLIVSRICHIVLIVWFISTSFIALDFFRQLRADTVSVGGYDMVFVMHILTAAMFPPVNVYIINDANGVAVWD